MPLGNLWVSNTTEWLPCENSFPANSAISGLKASARREGKDSEACCWSRKPFSLQSSSER